MDDDEPTYEIDQQKINAIIDEYDITSDEPLNLKSKRPEGIIIDENNAHEVCERIKAKKAKKLTLRGNKLRSSGMQIVAKKLIEAPECELKYLDLGTTYLELSGVSALSRSLSINTSIKELNMNGTNTRRFDVEKLLEGVNSSTSISTFFLRVSELFITLDFKPQKAEDDMTQIETFLLTNKNIDHFDLACNDIKPDRADRFVRVMEHGNYTLKRFDITPHRRYDLTEQQKRLDKIGEMNCHLDLIDYETLNKFGTDELCHYLELLRVSKDCITSVKKNKYNGTDFINLMLDGKKVDDDFVPKIADSKFDKDTAIRIRKFLIDRYCAFRLKAGPEDAKGGSGPKKFEISSRTVPPIFEFDRYSADMLIGFLKLAGEDKEALKRFQYNRKPLNGHVFLSLMKDGILDRELRAQKMPEDVVTRALTLQDALAKFGVSISRYSYPNVKFEGTIPIYNIGIDNEMDNIDEAFGLVKDSIDGLLYEKMEKNVEGKLHDEDFRKKVDKYGLTDDELKAILYLTSFDKVDDNYLLYNINFRLENDADISQNIHDFIGFVQDGLEKIPVYDGIAYFVTPKVVNVNMKVKSIINPFSIIFATKNESELRPWIDERPGEYTLFKVKTVHARETSCICNTFKNEVLLTIDAGYTVKKVSDGIIEIEEDDD